MFTWQELLDLKIGWDGESDTPPPTILSIEIAKQIVCDGEKFNLFPEEIDADVIGGVAITYSNNGKTIWISCLNKGYNGYIIYEEGKKIIESKKYAKDSWSKILEKLGNKSSLP